MSTTEQNKVITANESFYQAIRDGDLDRMKTLWMNDDEVKCVHPGWPMLYGWDSVSQSFKSIFENGGVIGIELFDISAQVSGEVAWVICVEKISHTFGEQVQSGYAQSTNIFIKDGGDWLLSVHHASPMPTPGTEVSSGESLQ